LKLNRCPDLELLFQDLVQGNGPSLEHARSCERCSSVLEEHRQLEKDLYRLADPLPPPNFTSLVMARLAAHQAPIGLNVFLGFGILAVALGLGAFTLISGGAGASTLGIFAGSTLLAAKSLWVGAGRVTSILWSTAAIPMTVSLSLVLAICLFALKRLMVDRGSWSEARSSR
jgi:hypothetical protein